MTSEEYRHAIEQAGSRLQTYAAWLVGDLEEARDVAQEAMLRLWERCGDVQAPAARTWLLRTVHHLCVDVLRKRNGRGEVSLDAVRAALDEPVARPAVGTTGDNVRPAVLDAIAGLSVRDREVVVLREFCGMPYEEIAIVLGLSLNTVKITLHRARSRLRERLTSVVVRR